ncbi:exonuclease SbcCD subunit D [Paenibacillus wulumuqiensis]|uniref:exonuclease SbcCD subunit D n=1 Tax=Paenibacillus wulumuqiensis TaxID=1567107 RepID=UPI000619B97E|nr:exonuclease SbcCD subunit D [Paenibacillus wulumuqiensis]
MRILHTADWHFGKTLEGRSRLEEQAAFVDELTRIADEQQADLILMAGDVYDSVNPPAAAEQLFYEAAAKLTGNGRPMVIIAGNHDQPERISSATPLVRGRGIHLLGVPAAEGLQIHIPRTSETAVIAPLSYPSEARLNELLTDDNEENLIRRAYSERVGLLMKQLAAGFRPDTVNLAMSHIYVLGGVETDSERPIQVGGAYTVDPSALYTGAQYTALGHLHRAQAVKGEGMIRYSGSPLAYSFSEAGQAKSVTMLDIQPGGIPQMEEIFLTSGRPLVRWKAKGGLAEVYQWLEEGRDPNSFIDLEISLQEALAMSDIQNLRKVCGGIVNIRPVYPETEMQEQFSERSQLPVHELFRKFYERQTGGAVPEDRLVELFLELIDAEDAMESLSQDSDAR